MAPFNRKGGYPRLLDVLCYPEFESLALPVTSFFGAFQEFTLPLVDLLDYNRKSAFGAGLVYRQVPQCELALGVTVT